MKRTLFALLVLAGGFAAAVEMEAATGAAAPSRMIDGPMTPRLAAGASIAEVGSPPAEPASLRDALGTTLDDWNRAMPMRGI